MERLLSPELERWLGDPGRQPLVLRGARQVGKTWLVRDLARRAGRGLVELNLERNPESSRAFEVSDPRRILDDLGLEIGRSIDPKRDLLFLDEVQAAPNVLPALRWFGEELPELPVVAAGSLMEFALGDVDTGMPVGRVTYRHLEPLGFAEYLRAHGEHALLSRLERWGPGHEIGGTVHAKAGEWSTRFAMVGGMPAVVAADVERREPERCRRLQSDLMATFRDDFARYTRRLDPTVLDAVLRAVARQLGQKFVYARADEAVKQHQARRALELLALARLVTLAPHSDANGLPLGGEINERHRKAYLLDVGLLHALLRTPFERGPPDRGSLAPTVRSQVAEQVAGQQLRSVSPASGLEPELYYWQRFGGRAAEIDFLVQIGTMILPVEAKAGAAGSMKSLHQFMHDKGLDLAVRTDTNPPSLQDVAVRTTRGDPARYRLLNLPAYLLFRVRELVSLLTTS